MILPTIPNFLLSTKIDIKLIDGIDVNGSPKYGKTIKTKCRLEIYKVSKDDTSLDTPLYQFIAYIKSGSTKEDIKQQISYISLPVILQHNLIEEIKEYNIETNSKATINGKDYVIDKVDMHNNPDGTPNHSKLYLL